jgi:hypothetical protein
VLDPGDVRGFIVDPANSHVPRAIVVSYCPFAVKPLATDPAMLIPTDSAGHPLLGVQQVAPVPTEADFARGQAAERSKYFTEEDPRHPGVKWRSILAWRDVRTYSILEVTPYQGNQRAEVGEPDLMLLLPSRVPRPPGDLSAARFRAGLDLAPKIAALPVELVFAGIYLASVDRYQQSHH